MQSPIYMAKSSICSIIGIELEKCIGEEEMQLLVDSLVYGKLNKVRFQEIITSVLILTNNQL